MRRIIFSVVAIFVMCAMPALAFTGDYYPTEGYDESYHGTGMYVLTAGDLSKLTSSDDQRYVSYAVWNNRNYNDDDYIEFDFSPDVPSCAVVESVIITFEWQRTDICYNINSARLKIWDQSSSSWFIDNFPTPLPLLYIDRTEITDASSYINTVDDVNNLKIWFQVALNPAYPPADVTKHDLVKVTVTYSIPCDCYTDMPSCEQNECKWCPLCDETRVNQWYEGTCVDTEADCGYHCDTDYCGAECEGCDCQNYCSDNIRYFSGECDYSCFCSFQSENCDSYDRWYDTCNTQWVETDQCNEKEQKEQEYRDYYCDPEGCAYDVTDSQWVDTGNTRYKEAACDDGLYCTVDDMCVQGTCSGAPRDCSSLDGQCQVGVCDEELDSCVPDYTNYPLSTPCEADEDLCTIDHCDGLGSCVKDYDVDCSYLDGSFCEGSEIWEDVGYCSQGECYVDSYPVEDCYYYVEYCSDDDIVYNEGYCDQSTVTCSYETGFIESCYFYNEFCEGDSRVAEEGFCDYDTVTCKSDFCEVEDCSVYNYEDCQDTYYRHYYTESCYEDQGQTQCLPSSSLVDCRDELWCNGQEYCSEVDGVHCEAGEPVDCGSNDIPEVATCYFDPDNFASTFDWRCAFVSECVETGCNSGYCTQGDEAVNHACADSDDTDGVFYHGDVQTCEAECDGAGEECEPRIIGDYCYYGGECNTDPTVCSCKFAYDDYCPVPGTVIDDVCYYGEGSCSEEGCFIEQAPIRPCEYCDPLLGPGDYTAPVVSDISVSSPRCCETAEVTALVEDPMSCNNVVEAEYFFVNEGGCGDPGTGTPMSAQDGSFDSPSEIVEALIDVPCPDGAYNLWIRGKDAAGNWGECTFYMLIVQNSAPTTYDVYVEDLTVTATVEGLSVVGAEYFVDWMGPSGLGTPMDAVDGSFDSYLEDVIGELDSGLSPGLHRVYVHGKDGSGYWGLFAHADFTVYEGPEITITAPTAGWYKGTITVSHVTVGTACDYRYVDNGTESAWSSITCNADFDFDTSNCMDGESCAIELRASNGLFYGYDAVTISVDNSAPIITYVSVPEQAEQNETINITSDGYDPQGLKSCWAFLMSGEDVIESYNLGLDCSDEELIPDIADGNYIIKVRARNNVDTDSFAETGLIVGEGAPPSPPSPPGGGPSGGYYGSYTPEECVEQWVCTEWSECTGTQTRECVDENECGTVSSKPAEEQACEVPEPEEEPEEEEEIIEIQVPAVGITGLLLGAITDPLTAFIILIGIIILAYLLYRLLKRGKKKKGSVSIRARKKAKRRKK